jgi:hypothetical protein
MASPYVPPSLSGYNLNPPPDDGSQTPANQVTWNTSIKGKIGDPLMNFATAINTATTNAFATIPLNAVTSLSTAYTLAVADRGKLFVATAPLTITLAQAAVYGSGYEFSVKNTSGGNVLLAPTGTDLIEGANANYIILPGFTVTLVTDGVAGTGRWWVASPSVAPALGDVGRNLVHNAMFAVMQRAGPWTTNGAYTMDRWQINLVTDTVSVSRSVLSDTARAAIGDESATYGLTNVFTGSATAGSVNQVIQKMEGVRQSSGKTVIISFYASASAALNFGVNMLQNFGTGGSPSAPVSMTASVIAVGTTWTRYSATFVLPSTAGKTFGTNGDDYTQLTFVFSNQANAAIGVQSGTANLWGVQLEIAQPGQTQPTPLEKLEYADDLRHCQRFYQVGAAGMNGGYGAAAATFGYLGNLPVAMRANPTYTLSGQTYSNASGATVYAAGTSSSYMAIASVTATGGANFTTNFTASADL